MVTWPSWPPLVTWVAQIIEASEQAMNSASKVDMAMRLCFRDCHEIAQLLASTRRVALSMAGRWRRLTLMAPGSGMGEVGGGWWVVGGGWQAAYGGRNHDISQYHSLNLIFRVATATRSHNAKILNLYFFRKSPTLADSKY